MKIVELFVTELDREVERSRRALELVPDDKRAWKPHEKSMEFGYLCDMVATIPTWLTMIVKQDELDVAPKDGPGPQRPQSGTSADYIVALEKAAAEAKEALKGTTELHLQTHWKLLSGGEVVSDLPRHEMLRDTINHWAHHRGQMTVYLRLIGARVPALYGPSADDKRFD
ncbi:MAG: DinB family protein [Bryobacteraceae bacterium]